MTYIEFNSVYVEPDAPNVKSLCKLESIEHIEINTSADDEDNTGNYFVWLRLSSGEVVPFFRGTLQGCKKNYEIIKGKLLEMISDEKTK